MAFTTLYLSNRTASYTPATLRGTWDKTSVGVTRALGPVKTSDSGVNAEVASSIDFSGHSAPFEILMYRGVSGPLAAQTISGTLQVIIGAYEAVGDADAFFHVHVYVTQGDSDTPRGTLLTDYIDSSGTELSTSAVGASLTSAQTLSSLAISSGDRIVVEVGFSLRNNTSRSVSLYCGTEYDNSGLDLSADGVAVPDATLGGAAANHASFLTFSNSVVEADSTARISQLSARTLSVGAASARVSQITVRTLSQIGTTEGRVSQLSARTLSPFAGTSTSTTPVHHVGIQFEPDDDFIDVYSDVITEEGIRIRYGIDGNGPADVVASSGECAFSLNNSITNSGHLEGYYSPTHVNTRTGWRVGIPIRIWTVIGGVEYTKFRGRVGVITPEPGRLGPRQVHVVCYDHMHYVMRTSLRNVEAQVNQTDAVLVEQIYEAMPDAAKPPALLLDDAFETIPYAFDDLGDGPKAATALQAVCVSGQSIAFCRGDGTLVWKNRQTRALAASQVSLEDELRELDVTASADLAYNHVRVTIPNKSVGASPVVLWAASGIQVVYPGQTIEFSGNYFDPTNPTRRIGGTDVTDPVGGTDYAGNALPDGGGADLTSDLTVTMAAFASSVKLSITNTGSQDVYLVTNLGVTLLQVRGTPIYIDADQTFESIGGDGESPVELQMPYQGSATTAQQLADYILAHYNQTQHQLSGASFEATRSPALLVQAFAREPGDCITLTESVTGTTAVDVLIQAVEIEIRKRREADFTIFCRWGLSLALDPNVPPPPAPPADAGDLVVQYTGGGNDGGVDAGPPDSGSWNLTQDGDLVLTRTGSYGLTFSRLGADIRVKGVAGGGGGGSYQADGSGGPGGGGGASNLAGVVVPLSRFSYTCTVGRGAGAGGHLDSNGEAAFTVEDGHDTTFTGASTLLSLGGGKAGGIVSPSVGGLGGVATIGAGGVDGADGGDQGADGASGVTGGGGGGGQTGFGGATGGNGTDQIGGSGGAPSAVYGGNPFPDGGSTDATGGFGDDSVPNGGGGGGGGGGVLVGDRYCGGGGGGAGGTNIPGAPDTGLTFGGGGGNGVLVISLEP